MIGRFMCYGTLRSGDPGCLILYEGSWSECVSYRDRVSGWNVGRSYTLHVASAREVFQLHRAAYLRWRGAGGEVLR